MCYAECEGLQKSSRTQIAEDIIVLHFNKKLGQGGAILAGLKVAKGDIIITLDADYTVDPLEIPSIILPITKNNADFVNTSRFVFPMESDAMSFTHKIGNKIFALIISTILMKRFTDVFCGTKAFRRQLLLGKLTEKEWPALDMLFAARKNNLIIAEVPVHYKARKFGNSKVKTLKTGYFHLRETIVKSIKYYLL